MDTLTDRRAAELLPVAPAIPGLVIRRYEGRTDHPGMARVAPAALAAAGFVETVTAASLDAQYAHLRNCDPDRDIAVAELGGAIEAYCRLAWADRPTGERGVETLCRIDPAVRGRGIGSAFLDWQLDLASDLAAGFGPLTRPIVVAAYVDGPDAAARKAGATSAALGVVQENPHRAMELYEQLGFRVTAEQREYHLRLPQFVAAEAGR